MTSWPTYPPPAPSRPPKPWYRSAWLWIGAYIAIAVAACAALFVVFIVNLDEGFDDGYWVDQESVNSAVEEPCDDMATAAQQIQIFSTPSVGAAHLHHFAEVGRGIPAAIESVDDASGDSLRWRDDWNVVLDAVDAYAEELESDGQGTFGTPVDDDGDPVISEMSWVSDVACEVPPIIVALDPISSVYLY